MISEFQKFEGDLIDDVFFDVKNKVNDNVWWNIFEVVEQPIQDIRLMRIKTLVREENFY